jgi:CubicO group peptidase (beta-lactamase class C family)
MYRDAGIGARDETSTEMVEKLARLPLMYQPGTVWEYGRSIDVLGCILERLSGMPLSEFLAERVFRPLRMPDTGFWVPPEKHNRIADVLGFDRRELFFVANPTTRAMLTPKPEPSDSSAWDEFRNDQKVHQLHQINTRELEMLSQVAMMGEIRSSRDFIYILNTIRQSLVTNA